MKWSVVAVYSCECGGCGRTIKGGSLKAMYFWMTLHLKLFCKNKPKDLASLPKLLWQLFRWRQP